MVWYVRDPCGMICAGITWSLIFYAQYVIYVCVLPATPSHTFQLFNGILFGSLSAFAFISHCRAMLTDPGAMPLNSATRENILRLGYKAGDVVIRCSRCHCVKPERTHHCSICKRCISKMDHHCPWVNNCVGERNQKFFILFTLYICLASFYSVYIVIHHFILCASRNWQKCEYVHSTPATTIFIVFLCVEALLFGLFTIFMCCDQLCSIWKDETGIEALKKRDRSPRYNEHPTAGATSINAGNASNSVRPFRSARGATMHTVDLTGDLGPLDEHAPTHPLLSSPSTDLTPSATSLEPECDLERGNLIENKGLLLSGTGLAGSGSRSAIRPRARGMTGWLNGRAVTNAQNALRMISPFHAPRLPFSPYFQVPLSGIDIE